MSKVSKRMKSARVLSEFESLFICPVCQSPIVVNDFSFVCRNNHTFDIARQGYINLLNQAVNTNYDKQLFEERRKIIAKSTFFDPLHGLIAETLQNFQLENPLTILDAGCGEGSHLVKICDRVETPTTGVGIDISKKGIIAAARHYEGRIWSVADLANLPFGGEQFDVILNILSPANYAEFNRVLSLGGLVMKVVPQQDYLRELRDFFYQDNEKQAYSNEKIVQLFRSYFREVTNTRVHYEVELTDSELNSLLQMTPLTWKNTTSEINRFLDSGSKTITVDLELLVGIK